MRYEPDHKEKTRQRVVREAARAIRARGPEKLAVAEVMAAAGLTHGGFYAHFPSRDALIEAAVGRMFEDGAANMAASLDSRPPAEGLAAYIDGYLSIAHRDTINAGCALPFLSADAPRLSSPARARYAEGAMGIASRLEACLAALGVDDPAAGASSMIAELVGALTLARAEPGSAASEQILARSRAGLKRRFGLAASAE